MGKEEHMKLRKTVLGTWIFCAMGMMTQAQPTWRVSGAPIGDTSTYLYPAGGWSSANSLILAHAGGEDSLRVFSATGTPSGIHIYRVDVEPNAICGLSEIAGNHTYFGVFVVGGTSPSYDISYHYGGNPFIIPADEGSLALARRSTNADTACTAWADAGALLDVTGDSLSKSLLSGRNEIILTLETPLPVELLSFEASCGNEDVLLEWETATETNNDHFLIERTEDMLHIETIGTIAGQGNSDRLIRYSFTDPAPLPTAYYRLKQVDFDGTYSSSKWVWCACNMSNGPWLNVFPNPADDRISIGFSGSQDEKVVVRIYDNLGREIQRTDFVPVDETCTVQFSLDGILPGIYTLVVQTAQKSTTFKIVKK
jgi:hypothetical protein